MELKAKAEECFQKMKGLSAAEIEELAEEYVKAKLYENDFDAEVPSKKYECGKHSKKSEVVI